MFKTRIISVFLYSLSLNLAKSILIWTVQDIINFGFIFQFSKHEAI